MENKKLLVVDDDANVQEILKLYLERENFSVSLLDNGKDALDAVETDGFDLIILDIMMPELEGWEVLEKLRIKGIDAPVILLTARSQEYDRVRGLELGADDYIVKPFSPLEVLARVKAVLRRVQPSEDEINLPGLYVNVSRHQVLRAGENIKLTPKEFDLLVFLLRNEGRVFNRDILLDKVWGYEYPGDVRTVDVHIKGLRKKLGSSSVWSIETVWGKGYKFQVEYK